MSARRCAGLALLVLTLTASARAQVLTDLGGPSGYGDPCPGLEPCDDCSSSRVALAAAFPAGLCLGVGDPSDAGAGPRYGDLFVNNNGNVTLGQPFRSFEPRPLPVAPTPMFAPFWADVDTRADGRPARNGVFCHLSPGRLVVTWSHVGYFPTGRDLDNTFQLVVRADPSCGVGDFDVEFRYGPIAWTSGATSGGDGGLGGAAASAGLDWGNGRDFIEVPGSGTAALLRRFRQEGNTSEGNGVWRWRVRGCDASAGCADAGGRCDTGLPGLCAVGSVRCNAGSPRACVPALLPGAEACDGLDNDCDGRIDDGAGLCPSGQTCLRGRCLARCLPELGCPASASCGPDGFCVEAACATVRCAEGERCVAGRCLRECDDVLCPTGLACRADRCVDPCDGVACPPGRRCEPAAGAGPGLCVAACPCAPCGDAERCVAGRCVEVSCLGVVCDAGEACVGGRCTSRCDGARCPSGERCVAGRCEPPGPDAGTRDAGAVHDASDDAGRSEDVTPRAARPAPGCSCGVKTQRATGAGGLALLAALGVGRRRRRGPGGRYAACSIRRA